MSDYGRPGRKRRVAGQRPGRRPGQPDAEPQDDTTVEAEPETRPEPEPETKAEAEPEPEPEPEPETEAEVEGAAGGPGRRGRVLVGLLAAFVAIMLALAGVLGQKALANRNEEQGRNAAVGAASRAAALILSYDHRKLEENFAAARATLTPEFAERFDQTTKVVGQGATQTKATVEADVREAAVSSSGENVVTVLLFVNQTTTSTVTKGKPRVDLNRARFVMVRSGDAWLVQQIDGL